MKRIFIVLTSILLIKISAIAGWKVEVENDVMTNEKSCYVVSNSVSSLKPMGFPYANVKEFIGVGIKSNDIPWVYLGHSTTPNLTDAKTQNGYNETTSRIKFDNEIKEIVMTQDWGSRFIHIANYYKEYDSETNNFKNENKNDFDFIERLIKTKTVLVELEWFGDGKVYFKHNVSGFTKAYEDARKKCGLQPSHTLAITSPQKNINIELNISSQSNSSVTSSSKENFDEYHSMINSYILKRWYHYPLLTDYNYFVSANITIDPNGIFGFEILKYSGNTTVDKAVKEFLQNQTSEKYPIAPDKTTKTMKINFMP